MKGFTLEVLGVINFGLYQINITLYFAHKRCWTFSIFSKTLQHTKKLVYHKIWYLL